MNEKCVLKDSFHCCSSTESKNDLYTIWSKKIAVANSLAFGFFVTKHSCWYFVAYKLSHVWHCPMARGRALDQFVIHRTRVRKLESSGWLIGKMYDHHFIVYQATALRNSLSPTELPRSIDHRLIIHERDDVPVRWMPHKYIVNGPICNYCQWSSFPARARQIRDDTFPPHSAFDRKNNHRTHLYNPGVEWLCAMSQTRPPLPLAWNANPEQVRYLSQFVPDTI